METAKWRGCNESEANESKGTNQRERCTIGDGTNEAQKEKSERRKENFVNWKLHIYFINVFSYLLFIYLM